MINEENTTKTALLKELYDLIYDRENQAYDVLRFILNNEFKHKFTVEELEDLNKFISENCMV